MNEGILMCKGQFGKTSPFKPEKYGISPVVSLFFYPSLSKIKHSHPNKTYVFEISKTRAIISQSVNVLLLELL